MKLSTNGKRLTVTLGRECSIIDVEAHSDLIRTLPEKINRIHLKIDDLAEMDTAYLQCIYSLKKEAQEKQIVMQTTGESKVFDHICRLYGLEKIPCCSPEKRKK